MINFNEKYANLWKLVDRLNGIEQHDQRCTPRSQDWRDLWKAIKTRKRIGHELKNIVVEEWRRWTGKCPKDDSEESGI